MKHKEQGTQYIYCFIYISGNRLNIALDYSWNHEQVTVKTRDTY